MKQVASRMGMGLLVIVCLGMIGFVIWGLTPLGPMPEARQALISDESVQVGTGKWLVFQSMQDTPTAGLILYPGGRVDYRSYAPLARMLAEQGYLVVIPRMPLNLAVLGVNSAAQIIEAYSSVGIWLVGGHSLGGAMAASYAVDHADQVDGVFLLAAYPAESKPLTENSIPVLSITASEDGLTTVEKIRAIYDLFPKGTKWVTIEGGNHAGFGWYGDQTGDGMASIPREEQQDLVVIAIHEFMSSIY